MNLYKVILSFILVTFLAFSITFGQVPSTCDPSTPSFIVNLTGKADSIWLSPNIARNGLCCGLDPYANPPIRCVEFLLTLDTGAQGIRFDIASGAIPPGSLGYQINCGTYYMVGENICLNGAGPHRLTFCKPGNNPNTYTIVSIPKPRVTPPITVSDGCSATLGTNGFELSTIQWTSVPYNATYNTYLNCTSACSTVVATYQPGAPPYVDYQVSGIATGGCLTNFNVRKTRVYFVNDKTAQILPQDPTICYGGTYAMLTAHGTGGAPPYNYLWSTGATTQSINVGVGTYWVEIKDTTSCPSARDSVTVTAFLSPITANAGPDLTSCANNPSVNISGNVTAASGGIWSGGTGTISPSNTSLNISYTPSSSEITAGGVNLTLTTTGNGTCPSASDVMHISIVPSPLVNAGPDRTVCANNAQVSLNGTVVNAGGGTWSGGAGTFVPNQNTLNATYIPTAAEILAGSLTLTLTSTGNGTCNPVSDNMMIIITPAPAINTGVDQTVCMNNAAVNLNPAVTVATGGSWTGGTGSFSPNRNVLNPVYTPSSTEKTAGFVILTITSTGNGNCIAVSDDIKININPEPVVNAGTDRTVCGNNASLLLSGSVTVATGGAWSGGTGTFTPSDTALNATYNPSAAEIDLGKATLTLTSTGNGLCLPVSDDMVITITPAPTVNAVTDKAICANNASTILSGTVTLATGGIWSGGSGTFSPNANSLSTQYIPAASEITTGSVTLILTTTGNGNCLPVTDNVLIQITPAPTIIAGPDQTVCATAATVPLSGSVSVSTGGIWTTSGSGTFSPNANTLNASYLPSPGDKISGSVTLALTSTGNGNCISVNDALVLTIQPQPVSNPGPAQSVCADASSFNLSGIVSNATGGIWSTTGSGTFSPGNTSLNTLYNLTATDKSTGSVTFTLTTTGNGVCSPVNSQKLITITTSVGVYAGPDISICKDATSVQLNGSVTTAMGGIWSSSGSGIFSPSATSLNAVYIPSSADKTSGSVSLTLISTGNGNCLPGQDELNITFTNPPTINSGPDQQRCSNSPAINLSGSVTISAGGMWTGGAGVFLPDRNSLSATYTPTPFEIASGNITLTLISTGNGTCNPVQDAMTINISPAPFVSAGPDQNICGAATSAQINAIAQNITYVSWTTTGTGTFANSNLAATDYFPSQADTTNHTVALQVSVNGLIGCNPAWDTMVINFTQVPSIDAGPDQNICETDIPLLLQASGSKARWTGGSGVFLPNDSTLNATYTPAAAELTAGSVNLNVTTIINSVCPQISDNVTITFIDAPIINAGSDITVCADTSGIPLNGSKQNATGIQWFTSGTGSFSPNDQTINATYIPSSSDTMIRNVTITINTTGTTVCNSVSDDLILTINPAPLVNAGYDNTVCANAGSVQLNGTVTNAIGGIWSTSGTGNFSTSNTILNPVYSISDTDTSSHQVSFILTSTDNGLCKAVYDTVKISIAPTPIVYAGKDTSICRDINNISLRGFTANTTGRLWSTSGTGIFSPSTTSMNPDYYPSTTDKNSGNVTLTLMVNATSVCSSQANSILLSITPPPTVSAGSDQTICADSNKINLTGSVTIATGGAWTSSGTGAFSSPNNLNSDYLVSPADSAAGSVILRLTTTGNGTCNPVTDEMTLNITPAPTVNPGPDIQICSDAGSINLFGATTVASGGIWSTSGSGIFVPLSNQLNTTYIPSDADTTKGVVTLTLTTTGNGSCKPVKDQMILTLTPVPLVDAGTVGPVCKDATTVALQGSVFNAGGGNWSSSGSGNFVNAANLSANYNPSASDKLNSSVTIYLTSTGNGTCKPVVDSFKLDMYPGPIADAGEDQIICADTDSILLSGEIFLAGGGKWTTSGSGVFTPNDSTLNAYYNPSDADTTSGSIYLYLTSTQNGGCNSVKDSIHVTITPAPSIHAGSDQLICASQNNINLSGLVSIATGGNWESSGTGNFSSGAANLNTTYVPSATDKSGGLTLIITSTGNGTCKPVKDTMNVLFAPAPVVNAGSIAICADNKGAPLSGSFSHANGILWTSTGTGSFTPTDTAVNTTYIPSTADFSTTYIKIFITSTGNGPCAVAKDTIDVTIKPAPVINAGPDITVCKDNPAVNLSGSVLNAGGGIWTSTGTGNFSPGTTQLNTVYNLSSADIDSGSVVIHLTTTGNGVCTPRMDSLLVTIIPKPTINAGTNKTICPDLLSINLNGTVFGSTGGQWTTTGTGTFSSSGSLNTIYNFSGADYSQTTASFYLISTGNGSCQAVKDTVTYTFLPLPIVNAGNDQGVCMDVEAIAFFGSYSNAPGITWTSTGTGAFSSTDNFITRYYPSQMDKDTGIVKIYLTSLAGNTCRIVIDTVNLFITPVPAAHTISDQIVCVDSDTITLTGTIINAPGSLWTTSGSGYFSPNSASLNSEYIISSADKSSGFVRIVLSTDGNIGCINTDSINITIYPAPDILVNDVSACIGDKVILNAQPANIPLLQPATFAWQKDHLSLPDSVPSILITEDGMYQVTYNIGSCTRIDSSHVVFHSQPETSVEDKLEFCKEKNFIITLDGGPGDHYVWMQSGNTGKQETVDKEGMYYVKVYNEFNCYTIDSVVVEDICPPRVFVPTIFTPDQDGSNDDLTVFGKYFTAYKLTIFNRWGEIIFHSEDPKATWDGTYLGKPMPNGVYPWILYYEGLTNKYKGPYHAEGSVTVDR